MNFSKGRCNLRNFSLCRKRVNDPTELVAIKTDGRGDREIRRERGKVYPLRISVRNVMRGLSTEYNCRLIAGSFRKRSNDAEAKSVGDGLKVSTNFAIDVNDL